MSACACRGARTVLSTAGRSRSYGPSGLGNYVARGRTRERRRSSGPGFGSSARARPELWVGRGAAGGAPAGEASSAREDARTAHTLRRGLTDAARLAAAARAAAAEERGRSASPAARLAKAFPTYADNGVPGPGSYEAYVPLGQSRSAPASPSASFYESRGPPRARGALLLPQCLAYGVTVHGTLPDSPELRLRRQLARAEGVAALRGHVGASVLGEALALSGSPPGGSPRARAQS